MTQFRIFLLLTFYVFISTQCNTTAQTMLPGYQLGVAFGSMCCGPASDSFLINFVQEKNRKSAQVISADVARGCGREGEYTVLMRLGSRADLEKVKAELERAITAENKKNEATQQNAGNISLVENPQKNDFDHCRLGIETWPVKNSADQ